MNSIEIKARRAALGLSQDELAALLGCQRPVLSDWETGKRKPRYPVELATSLDELEDILEGLVGDLVEQIEHASAVQNSQVVTKRTYLANEDWWAKDAEAGKLRLPAALHRVALARAAAEVRDDGISVIFEA